MIDYREILMLNSLEYNNTEIASCVHISRGTVQNLLEITSKIQIRWLLDDVTNRVLQTLKYPDRYNKDDNRMVPDYPKNHRNLAKKGVTLTLLWTKSCAEATIADKKPYMSSQFSRLHNRWAKISIATMRILRKPEDSIEVDWEGVTIDIVDPVTEMTSKVSPGLTTASYS